MSFFEGIKNMFSQSENGLSDEWHTLKEQNAVDEVIHSSDDKPQLIYKHSYRCSVCLFSKSNLEKQAEEITRFADMHFVDVISSREVSNYIAEQLGVRHESPQAILLHKGEVIWHASHGSIKSAKILEVLSHN
ncbi:MAG: bacillithiol system redox-active protein YtxJ [Balneolaceae bacterium]|nr:bacillithiol system redox-active protein YtxJ [Balneolaceae bacterium]